MPIWEQLGIERTRDKKKIRHAYAKMSARYHPEEHPEEFKEIYEAYQRALSYAAEPEFDDDMEDDLEEDGWEDLTEEVFNLQSSRLDEGKNGIDFSGVGEDTDTAKSEDLIGTNPQASESLEERERIDFSGFDEGTKAAKLEDLTGMASNPQLSGLAGEGKRIDFSVLDKEEDVPAEDPIQTRRIDGIIRNMQIIIRRTEKNIIWKCARIFVGGKNDTWMWEWRNLLQSSGFQKVRNDPQFLLKLNQLKGVSRLPLDMVECLYKELDFALLKERIEEMECQELHRIQRRIDKKEKIEKRDERILQVLMVIILALSGVCLLLNGLFAIIDFILTNW